MIEERFETLEGMFETQRKHASVPTFLLGIGYDMGIYPILIPKYPIFLGKPKIPKNIEYLGMSIGQVPI